MTKKPAIDFDNPWKEALFKKFEAFMLFFFPEAHAAIDWRRKPAFLESELRTITKKAKTGMRRADALVEVYLKDGRKQWVLIHIEIQSQRDSKFAERMYVYNYRIFEIYQRRAASFAILADEDESLRPSEYADEMLGTHANLRFPIAKLTDYKARIDTLLKDTNPFATLVFAHLKTQETRRDPNARLTWKLSIFRILLRCKWSKHDIREMIDIVDWLMVLPDNLQNEFVLESHRIKERKTMPHLNSWQVVGMRQGEIKSLRSSVCNLLKIRFGKVPAKLRSSVKQIEEVDRLNKLFTMAAKVDSLDAFKI